jgi:hypothetical protein
MAESLRAAQPQFRYCSVASPETGLLCERVAPPHEGFCHVSADGRCWVDAPGQPHGHDVLGEQTLFDPERANP